MDEPNVAANTLDSDTKASNVILGFCDRIIFWLVFLPFLLFQFVQIFFFSYLQYTNTNSVENSCYHYGLIYEGEGSIKKLKRALERLKNDKN